MTMTRNESEAEHDGMMRLLRKLLFFSLVFESIGMLPLEVLLSVIAVCLAIVMFAHFLCSNSVNSA